MNKPLTASAKRATLGAIAVLALVLVGTGVWWQSRTAVPSAEVSAFLDKTVGDGRFHFSLVEAKGRRLDDGSLQVTLAAKAVPRQALYSRVDTKEYLGRTFQADADSTADARGILADRGSRQDAKYRNAAPFPSDPYPLTIVQLTAAADSSLDYHGVVLARHGDGVWSFSIASGEFDKGVPPGEARAAFGDTTFLAGDAGDDARLRVQVSELQAFADRVAKIRRDIELARSAAVDDRRKAFLAQVAPGRVFKGLAQQVGRPTGTPLFLEIVSVSPEGEMTALLRNDASWRNARAFQGTWTADDEFQSPVLNLTSPAEQAIHGAGPFLENSQTWAFALAVDRQGSLAEKNLNYQYRFQPLPVDQVSSLENRLDGEFSQAIASTEPGLLYQGTATSRDSGASEPVLLRFIGRPEGGSSLEARIESTTRSWKRALRGSIFSNSRRSGAEPIRLRSASDGAVDDAPAVSVLGDRDDLDIRLGFEGPSLVGGDGHFTYRVSPVQETDLHKLEADRLDRTRRFLSILREGVVFDGTIKEDQGFIGHARIEFTRVDRKTGSVTATIRSLIRPSAYREFLGTCDPSGGSITLGATTRGAYGKDDNFDAPFLKGPSTTTLHLEVTPASITSRIDGDPHWSMEFPIGVFTAAPMESADAGSLPADGSAFPPFPMEPGAYLLTKGSWALMPKNQGHVVVETIRPESQFEMPGNVLGAIDEAVGEIIRQSKEKKKVPFLEFDGKDPRPVSTGAAIIVLYVGPEPGGSPPLELALAETTKDGQRRVVVKNSPANEIRLGEQRLAAYVRHAAPGYFLLTTTSVPAAGPYVLNAGVGYELTQE